ncbi:L7Ae/L30e/S12e/Gadd45 family ribosomal protein [Amedibacterium intestinale]|uniref:L7Ae/L30e/S12e/Gadd45 family ribosomal protein n=1 Tax=Amedibacterium intestinale TaxID=2583452 RepID=UPI000E204255
MNNAMGILGLAARARKIATGETVMKQLRSGKVKLVILSKDMGDNGKKKLLDKCSFYHVPYAFMECDEINQAIGDRNRKSVAILDEGFAQKLQTCLKG